MDILEIRKIKKRFGGVLALDSLSLTIRKGEITAVIGPNGSGKSTLINLLTGVVPWDQGVVAIDGVLISELSMEEVAEYGITRTFQEVRLFEQITVLDNILVILTSRSLWGSILERHSKLHLKQAEDVLKTVGLWDKRGDLVVNLSYGQRKLLEISRALAMKAEIYLFDEPFAGLFPEMTKLVASVLEGLRVQGKTVVLIEHNMDLIRQLSDWVCVLDGGTLLAEGRPEVVLSQREVIEAYLGD